MMTVSEHAVPLGPDAPLLLSIKAVAALCSVSRSTADEWCLNGTLVSIKVGGRRLVRRADLEAWIEAEAARARAEIAAGARTDLRLRRIGA